MTDCLFCKIIAGTVPSHKIYENDHVYAFLDIGPVSKGHTLVIPKQHVSNLSAGSPEDAVELMKAVYLLGRKIMPALGATGYNLGMNHGADAGQDVFHTHLHIMPRYPGDERKFVKTFPSKEELSVVAEKIRAEMGK